MGVPQTTFDELVQSWGRIRFFGRIFDEALHLKAESVRCEEHSGSAQIRFWCRGAPVKSMIISLPEARTLLGWLKERQPHRTPGKILHGAPTGFFAAELSEPGAGEIFVLSSISHADLSATASTLGIEIEGVRALESALEKYPGVLVLAGPDLPRLERTVTVLSFLFGWVSGGILSSGALVGSAASVVPLFLGVRADTIPEAIGEIGNTGIGVADLPLRGFLFDEQGKVVWHPPLGPTMAALRAKALSVRSKAGTKKPEQKRLGKERLLVVEDDLDQQQILQLMLQSEGYSVLTASNGVDALELLRENAVDGVITDLMMPVLDGKQLLQGIRRDPKFSALPVLVLSVIDDESKEREILDLGANGYCVKASQPKVILGRVRKLLESGRGDA